MLSTPQGRWPTYQLPILSTTSNISGDPQAYGKEWGGDITEGKRLLEILDVHMRDIELIKEAVAIMERYRAIEYAKEVTRRLVEEAWAEVDRWLRPSQAKETLRALAQFLIERSY